MGTEVRAGARGTLIVYALMIAAAVAVVLGIGHVGEHLVAPPLAAGAVPFGKGAANLHASVLVHVLLALAVVIVAARALGAAFRFLHQPAVIGEVVAGIALGPSLLGRVAPGASAFLLPKDVAPFLSMLAQIGVILFMFLVGLELDTSLLRKKTHATLAISHASIIVPFLLGTAFALWLYPRYATGDVPFLTFALFFGVSMSVTAFPVLARILTDRGMHKSRIGVVAISCAAVDDVTAWCLLALVVSVAQAKAGAAAKTVAMAIAYVVAVFVVVRPAVRAWVRRQDLRGASTGQGAVTVVFLALLVSALVTEAIGIHALFGAFLVGAVIPHESRIAREMTHKLEDIVIVLLLPAFFAFTGMRTQIGLVSGVADWLVCGAIVLLASVGKFGGSAVASRLAGLGWRDAGRVGALMNTRGLMELIVLNIGLDLRVISPTVFAMLVIMALLTTFATTPVLHLIDARERREVEGEADVAARG